MTSKQIEFSRRLPSSPCALSRSLTTAARNVDSLPTISRSIGSQPWFRESQSVWIYAILLVLANGTFCHAQFATAPSITAQQPFVVAPTYRTIVTYNGAICLSTPSYEVMPDGQFIFKRQGMRLDGYGYFWSPSIRDDIVRRNRLTTRVVGRSNEFWPPVASAASSNAVVAQRQITALPLSNPYFGAGLPSGTSPSQSSTSSASQSARIVRCPNGSFAIYCSDTNAVIAPSRRFFGQSGQ